MPDPAIVPVNGLSHVSAYVHRLMLSQKQATVLMISLLDREESFSVLRMNTGQMQVHLLANWPQSADSHQKAQMFFTRHHILWREEQSDGSRILMFPLSGNETTVTNMTQAILTQIIGVDSKAGLKFRYEERNF